MEPRPVAVVRRVLTAALAVVLLSASPVVAAGTGGIEVTPLPAVVDGKAVTAFHVTLPSKGRLSVRYALRNITTENKSARVYAAAARRLETGAFDIGDADSSPHVRLTDRTVQLDPKETRAETFEVRAPDGDRPKETVYAAVVIEVKRGSVVQRAATLIYLEPGTRAPLPRWAGFVAMATLAAVAVALVLVLRRRRRAAA